MHARGSMLTQSCVCPCMLILLFNLVQGSEAKTRHMILHVAVKASEFIHELL